MVVHDVDDGRDRRVIPRSSAFDDHQGRHVTFANEARRPESFDSNIRVSGRS